MEQKNVVFLKEVFQKMLFNSGKVPSDDDFDAYLRETMLQTNYLDTVWAINEFDISAGKADKAKDIVGPVLVIHGQ